MPQPSSLAHGTQDELPRIVLDTQVVLDWLVFRDTGCAALCAAIERGHLRWLATPAMRDELEHVLDRGIAATRRMSRASIAQAYDRHSLMVAPPLRAVSTLRCTDPSDQMFIDLSLSAGAHWLFTRDRALLALARRAAPYGLTVLQPTGWTP